jgi:5-carboxymethyl-2-hydroxymuconate isomerase
MPHLTIEYTSNLGMTTPAAMLGALNQTLVDTGHFKEADIKSRAYEVTHFAVGTSPENRGFFHAKLLILSGRDVPTRQAISKVLVDKMTSLLPARAGLHTQVTVDLVEIERETYAKAVISVE